MAARAMSLLFATLLTGAAHGAVVHRCKLADGSFAYRDTGCAAGEVLVSRQAYEMAVPAPTAAAPARSAEAARVSSAPGPRPARATGPARRPSGGGEIVAHECRFGEQRWVQAQACPARMQGDKAPVHETRLTRAGVCAALRGLSAARSPGEGSARRAYGMNRLRQRHGC